MEKQEVSATSWLNFILSSPENTQPVPDVATNDIASNKAVGSIRALVKWAAANGAAKHRVEAHRIFSSVEAKTVVQRILLEVTEGRIGIRDDKLLWADMGVRQNIINLLLCYSEPYLALGLEIMYNQVINDQSSKNLSKFITQHLLFNEPIASKFETQVKKHYRDGFKEELHKFTLHSFLTLVWLLDELKCSDVLPHCHTLFHKDSTIKASKQVLIAFCKDYMLGEGDVVRHLALVGYRVRYEQMFIEEFDFSVANIANDLKDGIRLVKVADVLGSRAASPLPPSLNVRCSCQT
jgi:abnormal spindle-like microcephaly-associated protein